MNDKQICTLLDRFVKYMKEHNNRLINPFTNESIGLSIIIL